WYHGGPRRSGVLVKRQVRSNRLVIFFGIGGQSVSGPVRGKYNLSRRTLHKSWRQVIVQITREREWRGACHTNKVKVILTSLVRTHRKHTTIARNIHINDLVQSPDISLAP